MIGRHADRRWTRLLGSLRGLAILVLVGCWTGAVAAQELTPRTYWPAPKGVKVGVLGYVYAEGDVLFDPSIPLYAVDSDVNLAVVAYLQTFSLWGRTANVLVDLPYQWGTTRGFIEDTPAEGSVSGFGDPGVTLTVNLLGAPTMTGQEFQALRQDPHPILGTSVKVIVPIGQYDPGRLLNVGGNRWAVKAELGAAIPIRPKVIFEVEGGVWFLGDDDDFLPGERKQDPIYGIEFHLIRRFKPGFWAAFDANFFYGGRQTIDGRELVDVKQNSRIGATLVVPFKGRHAVKLGYATGIFTEFGTDFDQYLVTYQMLFR
jgi:hypothetical protein